MTSINLNAVLVDYAMLLQEPFKLLVLLFLQQTTIEKKKSQIFI